MASSTTTGPRTAPNRPPMRGPRSSRSSESTSGRRTHMCTNIATKTRVTGSATTVAGWSNVDEATIGFDHATHLWTDHAVRFDFTRSGTADRVAIELDLPSAKALLRELQDVVGAAERSGVEG